MQTSRILFQAASTTGETYLFYLRTVPQGTLPRGPGNFARCFRMWNLDARGFHKGMWRFWIKKNHILAVGCPASVYCKTKPQDLKPIYLPNKETRETQGSSLMDAGVFTQEKVEFLF